MIKKMAKVVIVAAALIIAVAALFIYSAKGVSIRSADVINVSDFSLIGATIYGEIEVYNGGFLPIRVDRITYTARIEDIEGIIGQGEVTGGTVMAGESKVFPFTLKITWIPSLDTALSLLTSDLAYASINGTAHIIELKGLLRVELPFSARANLEGYIVQFIAGTPELIPEGLAGDVMDILEDVLGTVSEGAYDGAGYIKEGAGYIRDAVEGLG